MNGKLKALPSSLTYSQKQNTEFLDSVVFRDAYYDKIRQYIWSGETGDGTNPDDVLVIFGKYNEKTNNADKDAITDALIRRFEGNTVYPEVFYGQPVYKNPQAVRYVQEKGKPMLWWDDAFDNDHRHGKRLRSVIDILDPYLPAAITQKETEEADQLALVKEYKECCKEMREWLRRQADRLVQGGTDWNYIKLAEGNLNWIAFGEYKNGIRNTAA